MLMARTIDDVTLVNARVVSKRVSVYGTVLHHVAVGVDSTAGGLSFRVTYRPELRCRPLFTVATRRSCSSSSSAAPDIRIGHWQHGYIRDVVLLESGRFEVRTRKSISNAIRAALRRPGG